MTATAQLNRRGGGPIVTPAGATQELPTGYLYGNALNYISASTVQVEAGAARNIADNFDLRLAANTNAVLSASGVNGLDTGSEAASTWYYVWVIGDSTGANPTATLLSLSSTVGGLTFPAGYDRARRVGAVRNDGSSNLLQFNQYVRDSAARLIAYDEVERGVLQVLSGYGSLGFTTVNLGALVPPVTVYPWLNIESDSSSGTTPVVSVRPTGSAVAAPIHFTRVFGEDGAVFFVRSNSSQQVDIANSSTLNNTDAYVIGYRDHLLQ